MFFPLFLITYIKIIFNYNVNLLGVYVDFKIVINFFFQEITEKTIKNS